LNLFLSLFNNKTNQKIFLYIRYKIKKKEYENHITDLETDAIEKKQEIIELHEELRKCKDFISKCSHCTTFIEDTSSIQYKEKIEELIQLLQNEEKKRIKLEEKLMDIENQYQEIKDILQVRE
jgi:predicted RNase H-like nuclease (RuvC/YqgF family)